MKAINAPGACSHGRRGGEQGTRPKVRRYPRWVRACAMPPRKFRPTHKHGHSGVSAIVFAMYTPSCSRVGLFLFSFFAALLRATSTRGQA